MKWNRKNVTDAEILMHGSDKYSERSGKSIKLSNKPNSILNNQKIQPNQIN